jgi:hypothetical protein
VRPGIPITMAALVLAALAGGSARAVPAEPDSAAAPAPRRARPVARVPT